jgi:molybdenum cofactor cytidylyltransferase
MSSTSIAAILLAAGSSTRLGTSKQLLSYGGRSLLRHVAETALASSVTEVHVVVGFEAERMKTELGGLDVHLADNPNWNEGIASSIRAGISSLPHSVDAALILLCDQPLITASVLNEMINTYTATGKPIVACEYGGTVGVPVLFARSFFPELLRLRGDRGAKQLITQNLDQVTTIPFPGGSVDIDTLADKERFFSSNA